MDLLVRCAQWLYRPRNLIDLRTMRVGSTLKGGSCMVLTEDGELYDPIQDRCVTEEDPISE